MKVGTAAAAGLLALTTSLLHPAAPVHACACCTEPGQRLEMTAPYEDYIAAELARVEIAPTARLYTDAGFPESIEGIAHPSSGDYGIRLERSEGRIHLGLTEETGRTGSITIEVPSEITRFEVDTRDGEELAGGTGPALYKEWRLAGDATLSGIFAAASVRASAALILQGSGKGCTSAEDFTHWTLVLSGAGVRFTLLGKLETAR